VVLPGQRLSGSRGARPDDAALGESCESLFELVEVGEIATAALCFACGEPRSSVRRCDYLAGALRCLAIVDMAGHKMPTVSHYDQCWCETRRKAPGEEDITRFFGPLARYAIGERLVRTARPPFLLAFFLVRL